MALPCFVCSFVCSEPFRPAAASLRLRHQVENRWRAYGGRTRSLAMPVTFCIRLRPRPPGLSTTLFTTGANVVLTLPARSVRPSALSVTRVARPLRRLRCRTCSARSMRRGKSSSHSCWPGM
jgi:hypothetical protein